jgi:signal transduction histidine kinase
MTVPLQLVKMSAARRSVSIATELDLAGRRLRVDGPKIEQVFTNLLSNAIEHAPDGSTVLVDGRIEADGVRFSVTDTGPGFSEEQRSRLFGAFSATGGRKKDGERSIGLGLAISRRIVEAHGGRVFATSAPGQGATVGFTLPAACLTEPPLVNTQGGE